METVCEYVNLKIHALKYNLDVSGAFTVELMKNICLNNIKQAIGRDFKYLFILDLYIALYETFENSDNNEYYRNYKNLIKKYDKQLSRDEKGFHFSKLINYLILKDLKHSGSKEYALELFEVYKIFLEKKLYQNKKIDYLPESLYRAILFLGIRLRELEWVITFIDKYTPLVQSKNKDNLQIFGYAFYYFSKSDFEKSLELTNKINFDYFIFKFDVKALIIKIYFELGYFENALSILHSFKELLRTDNFLNRDTKEYYYNFMKIMKELIMLKIQNKTEADYTAIKLKSMENVLNKDWLLKKFNEIKKSAMKVNAG